MQYCKKYLQSIQMDAHRWEDPLAWQHCTQSTFYTNLFTFPSIITFSFTFTFNCVFTFKQRSPKVKFSLSLFFHQHRLEEEFPLKTLHAINFLPNFSLALFPITYLPITQATSQNLLFFQPKFKSEFCEFTGFHSPLFKRTILLGKY